MTNSNKKHKLISFLLILSFILNCAIQTGCKNKFPNGCVKIFFCAQYLSDSNSNLINVIDEFEKKCQIKVCTYSTFESNEQLYAKLKYSQFKYDVILPSDYMISRLIKENMLQKINKNLIPNYKQINYIYQGSSCGFDLTNEFSVPYTWGTVGIIYNKPRIEKITQQNANKVITGFDCLFNNKFNKEVLMFSNSKDAFAIALKTLNYSINTTNLNEIKQAQQLLKQQKKIVQGYFTDEITDKMINEEAALSCAFSGDAQNMINENKNLKFCLPQNGSIMYVDAMCIPKNAQNVENAHKFINFMCSSKIAAINSTFSSFSTTLKHAYKILDDKIRTNKIAYPSENELKKCETQKFLDTETENTIAQLWEQVKI